MHGVWRQRALSSGLLLLPGRDFFYAVIFWECDREQEEFFSSYVILFSRASWPAHPPRIGFFRACCLSQLFPKTNWIKAAAEQWVSVHWEGKVGAAGCIIDSVRPKIKTPKVTWWETKWNERHFCIFIPHRQQLVAVTLSKHRAAGSLTFQDWNLARWRGTSERKASQRDEIIRNGIFRNVHICRRWPGGRSAQPGIQSGFGNVCVCFWSS